MVKQHAISTSARTRESLTRISSGVNPIDAQLGGFIAGRIHVFVGVPGTGKTSATLHFLDAALRGGERAALLTRDRGADLISHAAHLGIDLNPSLRSGRLFALRYRPDFASRLNSGASVGHVLDELRTAWGADPVQRIVINSCSPFLGDGAPSDARMLALTEFLEASGATSVVTLPGELSTATLDRRLEPLLDRAASVLRFSREPAGGGHYRVDVVKVRQSFSSSHPMRFTIDSPNGIAALPVAAAAGAAPSGPARSRRLAVLALGGTAAGILAELGVDGDSASAVSAADATRSGALAGVGALLVDVGRQQLDQLPARLRELGRAPLLPPLVVVAGFDVPPEERAGIFEAGADELLTIEMAPEERRARLSAAILRGRCAQPLPGPDARGGALGAATTTRGAL